ncbi:MAG: hypothetical protein HC911_00005, partial [Chloroflexaceae bacterium]|nr:hypothetical protein [Chloroflexaceae bacterium]
SMWPYVIPTSLTIFDAAAPESSQRFMLVGASVLIPLILGYTAYAYWVFRGKVRTGEGLPLIAAHRAPLPIPHHPPRARRLIRGLRSNLKRMSYHHTDPRMRPPALPARALPAPIPTSPRVSR